MIQGFETETAPLTDYERETVLPVIIDFLKYRLGKLAAITNKKLCDIFWEYKLSGPRVRKIINYIRINDLIPCLVATSDGYYVAQSEEELFNYEVSLRGREEAIRAVRQSVERQRKQVYGEEEPNLFDE